MLNPFPTTPKIEFKKTKYSSPCITFHEYLYFLDLEIIYFIGLLYILFILPRIFSFFPNDIMKNELVFYDLFICLLPLEQFNVLTNIKTFFYISTGPTIQK